MIIISSSLRILLASDVKSSCNVYNQLQIFVVLVTEAETST